MHITIGGESNIDDPCGGHCDDGDERAHRDYGSEADHDTVQKRSIVGERGNTTVCRRGRRIRHPQRYSNLIAYIDEETTAPRDAGNHAGI
jgi:hypothetical protein